MSIEDYSLYDCSEPSLSPFERDIYEEVSMEEPWTLVEKFADLNRISGSADEREAADYIEDRLRTMGINYERYEPSISISVPRDASCCFPDSKTTVEDDPTAFAAVKPELYSATGTVRGEVVRIPAGDGDDMLAGLNLDDRDLNGKVAVVEGFVSIDAKLNLEAAGVDGIVGVNPHEGEPQWGRVSTRAWGNVPEPEDEPDDPPVAITVERSAGEKLLDRLDGGETVELEISATVDDGWYDCPVVVAEIEAGQPLTKGDFVLLHAHYDGWYPGATDNATGDAGLLECARVFNEHQDELRRDLQVAWWPGHSQGSYSGSAWYVDEFALDLEEHCLAHVNMDSSGAKDATEFMSQVMWMSEADGLCRGAIRDVAGKETTEVRPIRAGDYSFNNLGVTGLLLLSSNIPQPVRRARGYHPAGSGGNSDAYHLSTDTLDKADPNVLVRDVRVYATILSRLLTNDIPPLDFRHTLDRHEEIVDEYAEAAGDAFDLGPVLDALEELSGDVERFHREVERGGVDPATATKTLRRLSRRLVRVNFSAKGRFEQDPTTSISPYPTLAGAVELPDTAPDERRARSMYLKRARNGIVYQLRRALDDVHDAFPEGEA